MAHPAHAEHVHRDHHPAGIGRWLFSTNHKDIGTMYLVLAMIGGVIGAGLSIAMRMEMQNPGIQFFHDSHAFSVFVTAHLTLGRNGRVRITISMRTSTRAVSARGRLDESRREPWLPGSERVLVDGAESPPPPCSPTSGLVV